MAKINSKQKGKRGELEWARLCRDEGYSKAARTAQFRGNTGQAGDVEGVPGLHMEVKRTNSLRIWDAYNQAVRDATANSQGHIPIVCHRADDRPWIVILSAADFFRIWREYDASMGLSEKEARKEDENGQRSEGDIAESP